MKEFSKPANPEAETYGGGGYPAGLLVAIVDGADAHGRPRISWHGGPAQPVIAETVWMPQQVDWNRCPGINVVIGFMGGNPARPMILGLLSAPPEAVEPEREPEVSDQREVLPRVVRIESSEEIVLECGKSKIMLRADGRITLLGGTLVSEATGTNRIRGGSVQIN